LASAGLRRLGFQISPGGQLQIDPDRPSSSSVPCGLLAVHLSVEEMLPCVGQGAIGLEGRENDQRLAAVFARLNDDATWYCVTAERAFLRGMGGGCMSPVAACAERANDQVRMRVVSFREERVRRGEGTARLNEAEALGFRLAEEMKEARKE